MDILSEQLSLGLKKQNKTEQLVPFTCQLESERKTMIQHH